MIGGSSASYLAHTPCARLFVLCFIGVETEGFLDYQGRAGDHFHCTVEPSPDLFRCRCLPFPKHGGQRFRGVGEGLWYSRGLGGGGGVWYFRGRGVLIPKGGGGRDILAVPGGAAVSRGRDKDRANT